MPLSFAAGLLLAMTFSRRRNDAVASMSHRRSPATLAVHPSEGVRELYMSGMKGRFEFTASFRTTALRGFFS